MRIEFLGVVSQETPRECNSGLKISVNEESR
jgi:hypothetical protein